MKKLNRNRYPQTKRSGHKVRGVSPEAEGSLCWERFVKEVGLEPEVNIWRKQLLMFSTSISFAR